jgi:DNA-binding NarL/FixJ family response regulator
MTQILIFASSPIAEAGLDSVLTAVPELEVLGSTTDLTLLHQRLQEQWPDVLLVETRSLENLQPLLDLIPTIDAMALVILTAAHHRGIVPQAIALGIQALLPVSASRAEIVAAIRAVAVGLLVIHPEFTAGVTDQDSALMSDPDSESAERLTAREIEVLGLLSQGLGNKAIAAQLHISEHTVKFHISTILGKLNAASRTEAVFIGLRRGLIML